MTAVKQSTALRRRQIVGAALAIVARDGIAALSVGAVAQACGLVPSALYRHFRGRDEIVDALIAALRERLLANVEAAKASSPDAIGRLRRLYDLHLAMAGGGAALPRVVFSDDVSSPASPRRRSVYRLLREYLDLVAAIVEEGRRSGEVRADADPAAVSGLFLGAVQHAAVLAHMGGRAFDLPAHADRVWAALRRSFAPAPLRRSPSPRLSRRHP